MGFSKSPEPEPEELKKRQKKATEKKDKVLKKQEPAVVKQERPKRGKSVPEIDKGDSSGSKVGKNVPAKTVGPKTLAILKTKSKPKSTSTKPTGAPAKTI